MKAAFKAFDLDGSGEISYEEFEETFAAGLEIDREELRRVFMEFDDNKSGFINYEEFKDFMKKLFKVIMNKQSQVGG
jgi:Ca2+-binding EF-hand superfamily protein